MIHPTTATTYSFYNTRRALSETPITCVLKKLHVQDCLVEDTTLKDTECTGLRITHRLNLQSSYKCCETKHEI